MPQRAFAELLNAEAERSLPAEDRPRYDSSVIARIEKGERRATVPDITLIAAVDPLRRGKLWLGWDEPEDSAMARRQGPSVIQEPPEDIYDQPVTTKRPSRRRA